MEESRFDSLISRLLGGELNSKELTATEVEEVSYFLYKRDLEKNFIDASISHHNRGPIDIIMHAYYPDADPRPDTDRTYVHTVYIECKQRGHPLALDETAKVFVVAIADQPDRLVIVCQQGIQDQVWIYASKLFESENRKGIFKNVRFEATSIDELLGLSEGDGGTDLRDYYKYSWKFWLRSLDQLQLVASAGRSAAGRINIAPQTKFLITIKETKGLPISGLRVMHNNRETLIIEKSSTNGLSVAENTAFHLSDRHLQWFLESNPSEWTWKLIPISGDDIDIDIDLSKATWQADPLLNFRLRSPSFKETLEELRYDMPLFTVIRGAAGVGKSYLCYDLLNNAVEAGANIKTITITERTSNELLLSLIWPLLWPRQGEGLTKKEKEAAAAIINATITQVAQDDEQKHALAEAIIKEEIPPHLVIEAVLLIAKILSVQNEQWIFYLKDCQYLSLDTANTLMLLFSNIIDKSSENIRFVLEARIEPQGHHVWDNLSQKLSIQFPVRYSEYIVEDYNLHNVADALSDLVVPSDIVGLSTALYNKAGGNALYITQVLRELMRKGIVVKSALSDDKYKVSDWVLLSDRLENVPKTLQGLLLSVSNALLNETLTSDNSKSRLCFLIDMLYFTELEYSTLIQDADVSDHDDFTLTLQNYGFIRFSAETDSPELVHELISLALIDALKLKHKFRIIAKELVEILSSEDYSFELQLAYLAQDAQQSGLASYKFENAANQAKTNNNYSIERLSLEGYFKILSNANSLDQSNYRKQIAVGLRLGGVEIQAGSQLKALRHLDSIIDSLQLTGTQIFDSNQEATLYLLDSFQQKLVLATRTMNPILFCSVWGNAFAMNNDLPPARHRNLLTRLVLICCAANSPRIARVVAEILLNNEFEGVTLAKETLYSDIGRIYLQSNPKLTLKYWKEGLDSASTERQRTHNLLNVMVGELIANNRFESKKNLAEFRVRLANTGVINQQLRFGLIEGLFHIKNGDFDSSILVTKKLLERAKKNNQFFWLWKCHNNLAVIYYELGRQTDAVDHISAALELIDNIWKFETVREHKLMEAFKVSCSMFGADGSQPKLEKSQYSGAYRVPLHNGSIILRDKKIAPEEIPQSLSEDHVMCRLVGSRKLLFALE